MNYLGRLTQMLCIHSWSNWAEKVYSSGYYDQEEWLERYCKRCGTVQQLLKDGTCITLHKDR